MTNKLMHKLLVILALMITVSTYAQNEGLKENYHQNVLGITKNGLITEQRGMVDYLTTIFGDQGQPATYDKQFSIPVYEMLTYELGTSQSADNTAFAHLMVWTKDKKKLVEVIYEKSGITDIPAPLAEARNKWIELCNQHSAMNLIENLYTSDAVYYNRGRTLIGHEQLTAEYAYMNNPSYTLTLTPKHIERVSDTIIYEIGQCSGSYNLPYVLVWKKQADDSWKIYFDTNY